MARPEPKLYLDPDSGAFVVEQYNWARPFSSFLPGIAGLWGVPLWSYFVNRGQAIASAGVRDKDGQILEFQSFNLACARVPREGYRTFLTVDGGPVYEPFRKTERTDVSQTMVIFPHELVLRERNRRLGLELLVAYYTLPGTPISALVRRVRIRNLKKKKRRLEWIDGLPRVLPYGLDQARIKGIPRHIEAMMGVVMRGRVPLFRLKQTPDDSERIGEITGGNFYLPVGKNRGVVVDPEAVFGEELGYDRAWTFESGGLDAVAAAPQFRENRTPSAFTLRRDELPPDGTVEGSSVLGYVERDEDLDALRAMTRRKRYLDDKRDENASIVGEVADRAFTISSNPAFDAYARQDFLDNVMRGGMPVMFDTADGPSAVYVYSRQNGDLERDYHFFVLEPTYLSQGTGHYRSVLQNRRTDTWFFPESADANLRTFLDLVQLDGYNPLEVLGTSYRLADRAAAKRWAKEHFSAALRNDALALLDGRFTAGWLAQRLCELLDEGAWAIEDILRAAIACCVQNEVGGLHEGFWVDHWHYNFDLLDTYLMVYPDRLQALLLDGRSYGFFDDPDVIVPRSEKSVDVGGRIRQYGAVVRDPDKLAMIDARTEDRYRVRTEHGKGEVYRTNLLVKLLSIVVNRLATLDPAGTGIEKEAGKPGWNDSMNGLPGLFGSGLSEALELRRAVRFLDGALSNVDPSLEVPVYEELFTFVEALRTVIRERVKSKSKSAALRYWDRATALKETYREATRFGVDGAEVPMTVGEIRELMSDGSALLDRIFDGNVQNAAGVPYTYFVNDVTKFEATKHVSHLGYPTVRPKEFTQRPVRLFLEGPVHWMKDRPEDAARVYAAVRKSALYDRKLGMYKSCENMEGESYELGRAVGAYPRGWIENESIYLHMEYKWLLEILRSGLCQEFWRDCQRALIPFTDPEAYGRSILEGASFLVSSAYADGRQHGRAFQPRLSGITCEFLHMWILAVAGEKPLSLLDDGSLALTLRPRLPGWLFTEAKTTRRHHDFRDGWTELTVPKNAFAFKLFDRALVVYDNPSRADTWGARGARPVHHALRFRDGSTVEVEGDCVPAPHAEAIRDGRVRRIDVRLAR